MDALAGCPGGRHAALHLAGGLMVQLGEFGDPRLAPPGA